MQTGLLAGLAGLAGCAPAPRTFTIRLADGQDLLVRSIGTGPDTVLVLHAGPGLHGGYLVPMLTPLASGHTFLIYDQRGRGRSGAAVDTERLSVGQDLEDLETVRTRFGLWQPTLLGHGWGALLAALYTLDHPDRVGRLLMVGPLFPRAMHSWGLTMFPYELPDSLALVGLDSARLAGLDRSDPAAFCRRFWGAWLSPATVRDRATIRALKSPMCSVPPEALARVEAVNRAVLRTLGNWDLRPRLAGLTVPTLLIQGMGTANSDSSAATVWRAASREWTESAPHSGVVFLPGPAQFPWVGQQAVFNRIAATFLGGGWPSEARAPRSRITAR